MYNKRGSINNAPFAELSGDDTNGHGNEMITIYQWLPGTYDIYVHNYSDTDSFPEAVTVSIENNGKIKFAVSRTEPIRGNACWHPFSISSGKIIAKNDVVELPIP